jgi:chaperonin GroEL (HSP60 family)
LSSVFYQILDNAGKELKPAQVERLINNPFLGYNVMTDQVADMYKIGIVDSAYVTMRAIENAATIIGDIITTEVCIVNPELYRDNRRLL